jgi:hypothetical protein
MVNLRIPTTLVSKIYYSRIRTFRKITFFMLCVTRIFKSNFECLRLVTMTKYAARNEN